MKQIEIKLSQTLRLVFSMAFLSTNISYSQDFGADLLILMFGEELNLDQELTFNLI